MDVNRLKPYNWQHEDWPNFKYNSAFAEAQWLDFVHGTGKIGGLVEALPEQVKGDALIDIMVQEAMKTSEIEGEYLNREDVWSSIKKNLGFKAYQGQQYEARAEGAAALMVNLRQQYQKPLTQKMLFEWHKMLMKGTKGIKVGQWRKHAEPMQVVSGAYGKIKVHFEAPPSAQVPAQMRDFVKWFNQTAPGGAKEIKLAPVRAALVHVYFESIHPFEDGNGRIGRALSEKALAQSMGRPVLLSLSRSIEANKKAYYEALQKAQRSNEVTPWVQYFVEVVQRAQQEAEQLVAFTLKKTRFFDKHGPLLNTRQHKAIVRMLRDGPGGFEGGMNARKYVGITKTSKATATRDLQELVEMGVFEQVGSGRSTRYEVVL